MKIEILEFMVSDLAVAIKAVHVCEGPTIENVQHKLAMSGFQATGKFDSKIPGEERTLEVWVFRRGYEFYLAQIPLTMGKSGLILTP